MVTKAIRGTTTLHTPGGSGSLSVSDGSTTVDPTTSIVFSGAVVSDGGGGEADVAISGSSAFSGARLEQAADYTVTPGSFIQIPWDTTVFDVGGYVGSNAGNVCFIAPATGYYVLQAVLDTALARKSASPRKFVRAWIQTAALGEQAADAITLEPSSITSSYRVFFNLNTGPVHIASGDVIQLAMQNNDADTVLGTTFSGVTYWTIMRVG